jgi:hypothetical protein
MQTCRSEHLLRLWGVDARANDARCCSLYLAYGTSTGWALNYCTFLVPGSSRLLDT